METLGLIFGMAGLSFALISYYRIEKLEKQLQETAVLDKNFSSKSI